eukprot:TRINITY_DN13578_c1_g1_i3.p2 TRINITY_DN13578_c1_g1~~TRINITY_DN13578_c1_g1_i3.p2  ORF type:complete len:155 (-),score=0.09 TRINITY_DN13578_c1_g1_i3:153-617(-)
MEILQKLQRYFGGILAGFTSKEYVSSLFNIDSIINLHNRFLNRMLCNRHENIYCCCTNLLYYQFMSSMMLFAFKVSCTKVLFQELQQIVFIVKNKKLKGFFCFVKFCLVLAGFKCVCTQVNSFVKVSNNNVFVMTKLQDIKSTFLIGGQVDTAA